MLHHIFVNILVTNGGLGIADAQLVEGLIQAKVGHHGGDHGVAVELAPLLHVLAVDIQDMVAGDDVALLVHSQAAVGIAVVGKAHIQLVFQNEVPQVLDVGGAGTLVDVVAVGLGIDHIGFGAQRVEHGLGNVPGAAVGAVQAHLHTLEGIHAQADQIAHIPVSAGHMVHGAADGIPLGQGEGRPILAEQLQLTVQEVFNQGDGGLFHLLAVAV